MSEDRDKSPPDGLIATQAIDNEFKRTKKHRIPKRTAEAVRLLLSGECKTQKAAAERVKMNAGHLCEQLKKPNVLAHIEQQTRVLLSQSQLQAAATLLRLLDEGKSEHVVKDIGIHILAMAGHKPTADAQVSVNIDIKAGYVIDLTDKPGRPVIDVSPTRVAHD